MRNHLFIFVASLIGIVGCTDLDYSEEAMSVNVPNGCESGVNSLIEKARWGEGKAFLELADCYRDGKGMEKDFVNMLGMISLADEFGSIDGIEDYLKTMPDGSEFKLVFETIDLFERKKTEEAQAKADELVAMKSIEALTVRGLMAIERGDTLVGNLLMEVAAAHGSTLSELLLCNPDWRGGMAPDTEKLKKMTEKTPFAYLFLANIYSGRNNESQKDERLATYYYLKADEHACLNKRGARWLLYHHRNGEKLPLSATDIQRLQMYAGETSEGN